jgi:hypothetical protein
MTRMSSGGLSIVRILPPGISSTLAGHLCSFSAADRDSMTLWLCTGICRLGLMKLRLKVTSYNYNSTNVGPHQT